MVKLFRGDLCVRWRVDTEHDTAYHGDTPMYQTFRGKHYTLLLQLALLAYQHFPPLSPPRPHQKVWGTGLLPSKVWGKVWGHHMKE